MLAVAAAVLWLAWICTPLVAHPGRIAAGPLPGDVIYGHWLYDYVASELASGRWPMDFRDFSWPEPVVRPREIPAIMDAVVAAPLAWLLPYPAQMQWTHVLIIVVNGAGAGLLAAGMRARHGGILIAVVLGAVVPSAWRDIQVGHLNSAWLGATTTTIGGVLLLARARRLPGWAWPPLVLAVALAAAVALLAYPPFAVLSVPFAAVVGLGPLRQRPRHTLVVVAAVIGVALLLAWPDLSVIAGYTDEKLATCAQARCPLMNWYIPADQLWLWVPPANELRPLSPWGAGSAFAVLALALFPGEGWGRRVAAGAWCAGAFALAQGPCNLEQAGQLLSDVIPSTARLWCRLDPLHDWGRLMALGCALGAGLAGASAEAAWRWWRPVGGVALVLGALAAGHAGSLLYQLQLDRPDYWQQYTPPPAAALLADVSGPGANLPFDVYEQLAVAIETDHFVQLNPLNPTMREPISTNRHLQALTWLTAMGHGNTSTPAPSLRAVRATGLRWVLLDRSRCDRAPLPSPSACSAALEQALTDVLGPPDRTEGPLRLWRLDPETP